MSDTNAQEPTMEEILASIRRIISEDEPAAVEAAPEPAAVAPPAPVAQAPVAQAPVAQAPVAQALAAPPAPKPAPPPTEDDVLELTDPVDAPRPPSAPPAYKETVGDLDVFSAAPAPLPPPRPAPAPSFEEPLIGSYAAEQSAGHFSTLARSVTMPKEGRTLEDLVREMLKPMLRDWLDHHLPAIVEARVQAEVERISRRQEF